MFWKICKVLLAFAILILIESYVTKYNVADFLIVFMLTIVLFDVFGE